MKKNNLILNLIYQITYQIFVILVPIVTTPYVSRIFNADLLGNNSFVVTISNYFVLFSMLGIEKLGCRNISKVKDNKELLNQEFSGLYYCHLICAIIMTFLYLVFVKCYTTNYKYLFVISVFYLISAIIDINWLFFGLEKFDITVKRNVVIKLISVVSIFVFVKKPEDLWIYALILALTNVLSNVYLWTVYKRYVSFVKIDFSVILSYMKPLIWLFLPVVAVSIYRQMDKIMLGFLASKYQLGLYEQTEKLINIGAQVTAAIGTVMLPRCSYLYSRGEDDKAKEMIKYSNYFSAFIGVAICFGFISISNNLCQVYLGELYLECEPLINTLSITIIVLSFANVIRTHYLLPKEKDKIYIMSAFIGAFINFSLNIILIHYLGALGAVYGTIAAELSVAFVQCYSVRKELDLKKLMLQYIPFAGIGLVMCFVIKLFNALGQSSIMQLVFDIIIGACVYIILSICYFFFFSKEEFVVLKTMIKSKLFIR